MAGEVLTLSRALKITYEEGRVPLADFISTFFPRVMTYDTEEIPMDRIIPNRIMARYRDKNAGSNIVAYNPGKGYVYNPPSLDESTPIDEMLAGAVMAGLETNAPATMKIVKAVSDIRAQHDDMITRALVKQAMDIFTTGKFQPIGNNGVKIGQPFDFERNTGNTIKKSYGTSAVNQLTDAYDHYIKMHGPVGNLFALVGSSVLAQLETDPDFEKALNLQGLNAGKVYLTGDNRVLAEMVEMKIPKRAARIRILVFNEDYEEINVAGESSFTPYMPPKGLILSSFNAVRMQLYGGVFIINKAGVGQMMEGTMITDSFNTKNPDAFILRSQSRPLLVPGNVNHIVYAENISA